MANPYEELGARFRQRLKDPAPFKDVSDADLGKRLAEKSPQIKAAVEAKMTQPTQQPEAKVETTPQGPSISSKAKDALSKAYGVVSKFFKAKKEFSQGSAKEVAKEVVNAVNIIDRYNPGSMLGRLITGKEERDIPTDALEPRTPFEKAGAITAQVAGLAVPVGGQLKAAAGAGRLAKTAIGAANVARDVAQAGVMTKLQTGDTEQALDTAKMTAIISPVAAKAFPAVSNWLQKSSLRLTPAMKEKLGTKLDDVVGYLNQKKIVGTPTGRFAKVEKIVEDTETKLQSFLSGPAKNVTVDKKSLISDLNKIKAKYKGERDSSAIYRQIDEAVGNIQADFGSKVSLKELNKFKRSTYKNAYNRAGDKVLDFVEHDIGDTVRRTMEKKLDAAAKGKGISIDGVKLGDFNREYGTALTAMKLLKTASTRPQTGFIQRLVSSVIGAGVGNVFGPAGSYVGASVAPAVTEVIGGGLMRSGAAAALQGASKAPAAIVGRGTDELRRFLFPN
jgi:hypothetical protein